MADKHSLLGAVALNPTLRLHLPSRTVSLRIPTPPPHIALVSGGGAGHEPPTLGSPGHGMLTASVSGRYIRQSKCKADPQCHLVCRIRRSSSSPSSETTRPRDVLVIINNYTGDRLNFGLAIERARARYPNLNMDVSLLPQATKDGQEQPIVGPRGLAGNILVCKVLGAYTAFGAKGGGNRVRDLLSVRAKRLGTPSVANLRSIGAALGHCHVPGRNVHSGEIIEPGFVELAWRARASLASPIWLVSEMIEMIRASGSGWIGFEVNKNAVLRRLPASRFRFLRRVDSTW
ncbi:hypothetical protein EDC04DRAFT_2849344 [Pisolithus marmoratus]|nr:hypothetical protein EDC04DRAFT_2849344 [Pisolithus marmoratus]